MGIVDEIIKNKKDTSIVNRIMNNEFDFSNVKQPKTTNTLKGEYKNQLKRQNELKNLFGQNISKKGVEVTVNNFGTQRVATPIQERLENLRNKNFNYNKDSLKRNVELEKKYQDIKKSDEYKKQEEELVEQSNKTAMANYDYLVSKVGDKKVNWWDKSIGRLINAPGQLLDRGPLIKNEQGSYQYLPSQTDLIEQKISDSYETKLGKFLGDTTSEIGKIGFSTLMNSVIPYSGTATYFGDIYMDTYNEAISEGYDDTSALLYATTGTGLEFLTSKLLGSATKKLTGGKTSELSKALKKTTDRLLGDGRVSNFLANAGSEGIEEFIQEYIGNINKLITLEHSTDISDYWNTIWNIGILQDALYSGWVGALTGGVLGGKNTDVYTEFNNALEQTKNATTDVKTKEAITKVQEEVKNQIELENSEHNVEYYEKKKKKVENIIKNSTDETEINRMKKVDVLIDNKINELKKSTDTKVEKITPKENTTKTTPEKNTLDDDGKVIINDKKTLDNVREIDEDYKKFKETNEKMYSDDKDNLKRNNIRYGYMNAQDKRNTMQGDYLIPVKGGLTEKELDAKINKLKSNYVGKEVIVNGKEGKVVGNAFGKVKVELEDGTTSMYEKEDVKPKVDIDELIKSQKEEFTKKVEPKKVEKVEPKKVEIQTVDNTELKSMFDKLTISDKNAVNKIIDLRAELKENPSKKSLVLQINNLQSGLSKDGKSYMSAYNRSQFKNKEVKKVEVKEPTQSDIFKEKLKSKMNIPEEKETSDVIRIEPKKENIAEEKPNTEVIEIKQGVSKFNERVKETERKKGTLNEKQLKQLDNVITYKIDTNAETIDRANTYIDKVGFDKAKEYYLNDFENKSKVTVDTIGRGQMLIKQALQKGDVTTVSEVLPVLSIQLTEAGKIVQAAQVYQYATPEMVVLKLQRTIDYLKRNNSKGAEDINLTQEQIKKIMDVYKDIPVSDTNGQQTGQQSGQQITEKTFDQKELKKVGDEVMKEIASQLKGTWLDKLTNWRYFSMLSLPATHVKNILSNVAMLKGLMNVKNFNARVIEKAVNSISPNTFENRIKTESEIYNTDAKKSELKQLKTELKKYKVTQDNARNIDNYNNRLKVIDKLQGEVQVNALHTEIDRIAKENRKITNEIEKLNEEFIKEKSQQNYTRSEALDKEIKELKKQRDNLKKISDKAKSKLPKGISTRTFKKISADTKEVAKLYLQDNKDVILNGSKYKSNESIESMKSVFGKDVLTEEVINLFEDNSMSIKDRSSKALKIMRDNLVNKGESMSNAKRIATTIGNAMETITQLNYKSLELEDNINKTLAFRKTFAEVLTSNNIDDKISEIKTREEYKNLETLTEKDNYLYKTLESENPALFAAASNFATQEALEATFQQYNAVSAWLNYWQKNKSGKAIKFALDATIPFTKTPVNVAKTAIEYSPIGLLKSTIVDLGKVKSGEITANQYINNISKGLTGIQVMAVGYLLGSLGLLGGDDEDEYNLVIGDKSYSIDWLSPMSIILMTGARGANLIDEMNMSDMNSVQDNLFGMTKPFLDMSVLSSMTDVFDDYKYSGLQGVVENMVINYATQYIPTTSSALARVVDPVKRSTTVSKNSSYSFGEKLLKRLMYKVPGLSNKLPAKLDELGNEQITEGNILYRLYDAFVSPYDVKDNSSVLKELTDVYENTEDTGILPTMNNGTIKYKNTTYNLSDKEKNQYQKTYGKIVSNNISKLTSSDTYKDLTDKQKTKAIKYVYEHATDKAKENYFSNTDVEYERASSWSEESGVSLSDYAIFKSSIDNTDSDTKFQSTIDNIKKYQGNDSQKAYLYTSVYPTTEKTNKTIVDSKISFDSYLDFKERIRGIKGDEDPKSDVEGAVISGSKKKKILTEVAKTKNLTTTQKLLLTYLSGYSINNGDYVGISKNEARQTVFNYVNKLKISVDEKREILDKAGYTILKNGNIKW